MREFTKIDWNEAPEGATHYGKDNDWYRKSVTGWDWYCRSEDSWHSVSFTEAFSTSRLTPRPVFVWRGPQDGLPPVGTEVEAQHSTDWVRGVVVAHVTADEKLAIVQCEGYWVARDIASIRPITTERDRVIEEIEAVVKQAFCEQVYGGTVSQIVSVALYDAGYRKEVVR